jgi:hypothetical protein
VFLVHLVPFGLTYTMPWTMELIQTPLLFYGQCFYKEKGIEANCPKMSKHLLNESKI